MGNDTLQEWYSALCHIARDKNDTLVQVLSSSSDISFRPDFLGPLSGVMAPSSSPFGFNPHDMRTGWISLEPNSKWVFHRALSHSEIPVDNNNKLRSQRYD